jgi:hypothetical protein
VDPAAAPPAPAVRAGRVPGPARAGPGQGFRDGGVLGGAVSGGWGGRGRRGGRGGSPPLPSPRPGSCQSSRARRARTFCCVSSRMISITPGLQFTIASTSAFLTSKPRRLKTFSARRGGAGRRPKGEQRNGRLRACTLTARSPCPHTHTHGSASTSCRAFAAPSWQRSSCAAPRTWGSSGAPPQPAALR